METLPDELMELIFQFLSPLDQHALALASSGFYRLFHAKLQAFQTKRETFAFPRAYQSVSVNCLLAPFYYTLYLETMDNRLYEVSLGRPQQALFPCRIYLQLESETYLLYSNFWTHIPHINPICSIRKQAQFHIVLYALSGEIDICRRTHQYQHLPFFPS